MTEQPQAWKQERAPQQEGDRPADPTASLRTFSQGVGFVIQGLGATMFILTTCACCGIAFWEGDAMHRGIIDAQSRVSEGAPLLLMVNVLGSLALVAFGLGQQSDRGRIPAVGTAATTTAMALLYGMIVLASQMKTDSRSIEWPAIAGAVLALIMALCLPLTWAAARQVLRHPPLSSQAPTVPADAFPDPLARPRERHDSPADADIAKRRKRLEEEMRHLDDLQRQVRNQNRSDS